MGDKPSPRARPSHGRQGLCTVLAPHQGLLDVRGSLCPWPAGPGRENLAASRVLAAGRAFLWLEQREAAKVPCPSRGSDRVHELVDEALGDVGLADDSFLVVLADGAAQFVVIHGRAVLADAPKPRHLRRVLDLEDSWQGRGARRVTASPAPPSAPPAPSPGSLGHSSPPLSLLSQRMKRP